MTGNLNKILFSIYVRYESLDFIHQISLDIIVISNDPTKTQNW